MPLELFQKSREKAGRRHSDVDTQPKRHLFYAAELALLREAANQEDAIEKLPATLGSVLPAREQLGYLLLQQQQPCRAANEFRTALALAPGRRGALNGASQADELCR